MKTFPIFSIRLIICALWVLMLSPLAMAQTTGPATTATCAALDDTCASVDSTFSPSKIRLTTESGWMTVKCVGTTANIPSTPTR